jgi:hypothetical protein
MGNVSAPGFIVRRYPAGIKAEFQQPLKFETLPALSARPGQQVDPHLRKFAVAGYVYGSIVTYFRLVFGNVGRGARRY